MMWQDYWQRYRRFWWVPCLVLLGIITGGFYWHQTQQKQKVTHNEQLLATSASKTKPATKKTHQAATKKKGGFVDIKGAVAYPGIYPITVSETRLFEVLKNAGGPTDAADTKRLNLVQKLTDQLIIYIPKKGEVVTDQELIQAPQQIATTSERTPEQASTGTSANASSASDTAKIDLNQADSTQLQTLNGIGPKKAEQIIAYRDEQGKFKQIEDLQKVGGIGPKTFEQLQSQICVN